MTESNAGYLQDRAGVQSKVRKTMQNLSPSTEGRLALLGVLSFLSKLVDVKVWAYPGHTAASGGTGDKAQQKS